MAKKKTRKPTKPPKHPKQRERGKAISEADTWFSLYIRARDGRSVTSGSTQRLNCSHLFSRRFFATRWDEMNAYCQTAGENLYHNRDPGPLTSYFLDVHGEAAYHELYKRARSRAKFTTEDIFQVAAYWKMRYQEMTAKRDFFKVI